MMNMTDFVWKLHGGLKGYGRALLKDVFVWLILVILMLEGLVTWGVALFIAAILLYHAGTEMHLTWYRMALTQTQQWLDRSVAMLKTGQQKGFQAQMVRENPNRKDFN